MYSSAGISAGIDLALALLDEDHGRQLALDVARYLVLFVKRSGGQSQFSAHLHAQYSTMPIIEKVQRWCLDHLDEDLITHGLQPGCRHEHAQLRQKVPCGYRAFLRRVRAVDPPRGRIHADVGDDANAQGGRETLRLRFAVRDAAAVRRPSGYTATNLPTPLQALTQLTGADWLVPSRLSPQSSQIAPNRAQITPHPSERIVPEPEP